MTDIPDERVVAFVDGQLDGEALHAFKTRLASEPALVERVAAHRWMARQVTAAYGPAPHSNGDDALIARLGLVNRRVFELKNPRWLTGRRGPMKIAGLAALAASLVLAIIVVPVPVTPTSTLVRVADGRPTASGILAASLSTQLAGEPGRVQIGLSFRTDHGICRTFRSDRGVNGIGCRDGDHWLVPMMTAGVPESANTSTDYRLASGDFSPAIMAEVDREIRGEPLSLADELRLRQRHWR